MLGQSLAAVPIMVLEEQIENPFSVRCIWVFAINHILYELYELLLTVNDMPRHVILRIWEVHSELEIFNVVNRKTYRFICM